MKTWSANKGATQAEETKPVTHDPEAPVNVGAGGPTDAGWHSMADGIGCPKEGQYKHVRGVHLPLLQTPDHFAIGGMLHAGRATWFGAKFATDAATVEACRAACLKASEDHKLPVSQDAKDKALRYLDEYISFWSTRPRPQPVAAEYMVGPAPLQPGDQFPLWRTARLDDVSYYPEALNGLCIGEAKTTSGSIQDCIAQYTLHGQPLLQFVLWKNSNQGEKLHGPLKGVMLDIIKKGYGKEKSQFARHFVQVTDVTLAWYVKNMRRQLREYAAMDWNTDAERNIQYCTRIIGKSRAVCEYRDLCMHGRNAASKYVLRDGSSMATWKPSPGQETPPWE